jgi:4-amino-4-deoxychorismate lyase
VPVQDEMAPHGENGCMSKTALALLNQPSADVPPHRSGAPAFELVDPAVPQVSVLDLAATRGDGIFEALSVNAGRPHAVDAHLRRFAGSAAKLDLPAPDPHAWRAAIDAVIAELDGSAQTAGSRGSAGSEGPAGIAEALIKLVMSRGVEGDPEARPTGWVYGWPAPDHTVARTNGIAVVTLDRGYRHDVETSSPWLLAGAKTLSYAVNRAVLREAARRGADDVIFVSSDGFVLEGPTSSVVFRRGNALLTPGTGLGILEGTTQGDLFDWAATRGLQTGFELLTPADLGRADALWLVSSGRQAAPVRAIDGVEHPIDHDLSSEMNEYLLARKH